MAALPPTIFSRTRRAAVRARAARLQACPNAARFLIDDMVEDVIERLAFLRHEPRKALLIGDGTGDLAARLRSNGCEVSEPGDSLDEELPYPATGYDLIASLGTLDSVNDLPGALIHIRRALAPGGLAIASLCGAGSLVSLRQVLLAADGERPAARLHPLIDVRGGGQLLQRAGWVDPVVDSRGLNVAYRSLDQLVADLRAQGVSSMLTNAPPAIGKVALERARAAFGDMADSEGRVIERFEIVTLSGRR